jgi:hypothetical protein
MRDIQPESMGEKSSNRPSGTLLDLSPLGHPVWWLALAVLLVNDNLLKGQGVVPAWLTGKLSDFAFLMVAPVLLTCLLPVRLRARRTLAFAVVSTVFIAADLSPAASNAVVALARRLGMSWQLWPDVTDLLAFAVLPVGWWIAGGRGHLGVDWNHRLLHRSGVVLGAIACLATSAPPSWEHYPYFVNQTADSRTVTFTWLLRKVDCNADLSPIAARLTVGDLGEAHTTTLGANQVSALDVPPAQNATMGDVCQNSRSSSTASSDCTAVLVAVDNGPAALVSAQQHWEESDAGRSFISCDSSAKASACETKETGFSPDALSLYLKKGELAFQAGAKLKFASIDLAALMSRPDSPDSCLSQERSVLDLVDSATSCTNDHDCQTRPVGVAIPGEWLCRYLNRSLASSALERARDAWTGSCTTGEAPGCGSPLQPAVCRSGRCEPICPSTILHLCPATCASLDLEPQGICTAYYGSPPCLAPDGQLCTCSRQWDLRVCTPFQPVGDCPIACVSDSQTTWGLDASQPGAAVLDANSETASRDNRGAFDLVETGADSAEVDGTRAADARF